MIHSEFSSDYCTLYYTTLFILPGLTHSPRSDKAELAFNLNDVGTYLKYTKLMRDFLEPYSEEKQKDDLKYENCGSKYLTIRNSKAKHFPPLLL